jgi:hypothetical protein
MPATAIAVKTPTISTASGGCGRSMGGFAFSRNESKPQKWWTRKLRERGRRRRGHSSRAFRFEVIAVPDVPNGIHRVRHKCQHIVGAAVFILLRGQGGIEAMTLRHLGYRVGTPAFMQIAADLRSGQSCIGGAENVAYRLQICIIDFRNCRHRFSLPFRSFRLCGRSILKTV